MTQIPNQILALLSDADKNHICTECMSIMKRVVSCLVLTTTLILSCVTRFSVGLLISNSVRLSNYIVREREYGISSICLGVTRGVKNVNEESSARAHDPSMVKTAAHTHDSDVHRQLRFGRIRAWRRNSRSRRIEKSDKRNRLVGNIPVEGETSTGNKGKGLRRIGALNKSRFARKKEISRLKDKHEIGTIVKKEGKEGHEIVTEKGDKKRTDDGVRITFQASKLYERPLTLPSSEVKQLLQDYMTLSPESYSLLSNKDDMNDGVERRWNVRRLTKDESAQYRTKQFVDDYQLKYDVIESEGNYFRFSIPLKPLVGINITPVIDAFVYTPIISLTKKELDDANQGILIKSMKVSLLESDNKSITKSSTYQPKSPGISALVNTAPEAIEAIENFEGIITPRIQLSSRMYWSTGESSDGKSLHRFMSNDKAYLGIDTTVTTSFTIPSQLPIKVPRLVIKRVGSTVMEKILSKVLPKFLRQIELDFKRWQVHDEQ